VLLTSVEALVILGKDTEASLLYERVADAASAGTPVYGYASGLVEKTAGISAAETGDRERARQLLSEARAGYERIDMAKHVEMADALLRLAS
jgi:iron uptake system EfeUOB component EfeO/EfeM